MLRIVFLLFFIFFLTFFPGQAMATLYINEFSSGTSDSDWVEIYNSDTAPADLANYILRDSTSTNKIELFGQIDGNGFAVFDWSNKLNNSGDTIRLLLKSNESSIDQIIYGSGGIQAPTDSQTVGRNPDGSSNLVLLDSDSKNASNNSSGTVSTNTPTPLPTQKPSNTLKPTSTLKPTATIKPSATSRSQATLTKAPTSSTVKSTNMGNSEISSKKTNISGRIFPTAILGDSGSLSPTEDLKQMAGETKVLGESRSNLPVIFIVISGIIFTACGILVFFKIRKNKLNET